MSNLTRWLSTGLAAGVLLGTQSSAEAARLRFHYAAAGNCGTVTPQPTGPHGETAAYVSMFGECQPTCARPPGRAMQGAYQHPCTGQFVTVPLFLPEGTPVIQHRRNGVTYNYGSYAVEVFFRTDGSVDVDYYSPLARSF